MYKILVVDDEARIAEILEEFLPKSGFEVIKVLGGAEAIKVLSAEAKIDLMVLDIKMPKITGVDVIKEMEKISLKIPVVILTGSIDAEKYLVDLKRLGYATADLLYKPVDLFALLDVVKKKLRIAQ